MTIETIHFFYHKDPEAIELAEGETVEDHAIPFQIKKEGDAFDLAPIFVYMKGRIKSDDKVVFDPVKLRALVSKEA